MTETPVPRLVVLATTSRGRCVSTVSSPAAVAVSVVPVGPEPDDPLALLPDEGG